MTFTADELRDFIAGIVAEMHLDALCQYNKLLTALDKAREDHEARLATLEDNHKR